MLYGHAAAVFLSEDVKLDKLECVARSIGVMKRNLIDASAYVVERIQAYGCDLNAQSRYAMMNQILTHGYLEPNHPQFNSALEAVRDVQVMEFVFDQLADCEPADVLRSLVRRAIKDSTLPEQELGNSAGRNAQCELYVGAICQKAGMSPCFAEPDVQCTLDGVQYGIAVKRVKSESQIEKHIRKASRQIENVGTPGHIVLDISMAFNRDNQRLTGASDAELARAHRLARTQFGDDYYDRIKSWVRKRDARSVILIDHFVRQHPTDGWGLDSFTFFISLSPDNQRRHREFKAFRKQFSAGLATPPPSY